MPLPVREGFHAADAGPEARHSITWRRAGRTSPSRLTRLTF